MPDLDASVTSGVEPRGYRRGAAATDGWDQYVIPTTDRIVTYQGRTGTFRTPGRATVGQNILAIFNAAASGVLIDVEMLTCDVSIGGFKAVTVPPPTVRVYRIAALPVNGTALTKVGDDTSLTSSASVTLHGDASADQALSATGLGATPAGLLTQEFGPRITGTAAPGATPLFEPFDRAEFYTLGALRLTAGQGALLRLEAAATTSIPAVDLFMANIKWTEFTRP